MPLNEPTIWIFFFYRAVLPDLSDSRRNQKNLRTENKAPNFQALISPSPEIFRWRIKWYGTPKKKSKCLWLVYLSYHPLNFTFSHLTVWTARGQHRTRAVLHQSNCFEYPLKFLLKSSYQQCLLIFIFSKVSYLQRNSVMKHLKTKRKSLYHLGNLNSPFPLIIVCVVPFGCW